MALRFFIILFCYGIVSPGCTRHQNLQRTTVKATEIQPLVVSTPTLADLEINPKRVEVTLSDQQWNKYIVVVIEDLKKTALSKILRQSKADVLVEVQSFVEVGEQNKVTVTVSAYPARYRNFRSISLSDYSKLQKLKATQLQLAPSQVQEKSREHKPKQVQVLPSSPHHPKK